MMTVHAPIGVLLGGLFLVAGVGKLARRDAFAQALAGYRLARPRRLLAWAVPAAEIAVGAALVSGLPAAGWAALALLAVFSLALAVELAAGTAPPACGCLPGSRPPGPLSLVRNALLGLVAVAARAASASSRSLRSTRLLTQIPSASAGLHRAGGRYRHG